MLVKKAIVLSFAFYLVLTALPLFAFGEPSALLQGGINSYQKGNFDDAKVNFVQLIPEQNWTFIALYNLGNVAVRQKHFGEALGYYKRALNKKPHDGDTLYNLRFVEDSLGGRRYGGKISNFEIFRTDFLSRFSFSEGLAVTLVFSFLFLFSLTSYFRNRKILQMDDGVDSGGPSRVPPPSVFLMGFLFIIFLSVSALKLYDTYVDRGTIISANTDLRSGPSESNASMQQIQEGTEVVILDSSNDWKQVSLLNGGLAGWIPTKDLMVTNGGGPF